MLIQELFLLRLILWGRPIQEMDKMNYFWLHLLGQSFFYEHPFIRVYICVLIHAILFENLQCHVYFTTSCKYNEEFGRVSALCQDSLQKQEPTILI